MPRTFSSLANFTPHRVSVAVATREAAASGAQLPCFRMKPTQQANTKESEHRLCGSLWGWLPSALSLLVVAVTLSWRTLNAEPSLQPYARSRAPLNACPGRTVPSGDLYAFLGVAREFAAPQVRGGAPQTL